MRKEDIAGYIKDTARRVPNLNTKGTDKMGVWSGNLSYNRYFVEGDVDTHHLRHWILERVNQFAIPKLTVEAEEEQVLGWCTIENILATEFSTETLFYNEYILLALRIDSWKLPPTLLKARQQQLEREYLVETGKDSLTKRERDQLKKKLRTEMKEHSLPNVAAYDICWHWQQRVLRFWSMSSRMNTLFVEWFEKTFPGLQLVLQSPYTLAERIQLAESHLEVLQSLEPDTFATPMGSEEEES